jgi:hypothetical protein
MCRKKKKKTEAKTKTISISIEKHKTRQKESLKLYPLVNPATTSEPSLFITMPVRASLVPNSELKLSTWNRRLPNSDIQGTNFKYCLQLI